MYTVNTSFMVEPDVQEHWLRIVKTKYIPFLRENGYERLLLTRVLSSENTDHFTYSLQVTIDEMSDYTRLTEELFEEYINVMTPIFGQKVMWFISLLKHIDTEMETA